MREESLNFHRRSRIRIKPDILIVGFLRLCALLAAKDGLGCVHFDFRRDAEALLGSEGGAGIKDKAGNVLESGSWLERCAFEEGVDLFSVLAGELNPETIGGVLVSRFGDNSVQHDKSFWNGDLLLNK